MTHTFIVHMDLHPEGKRINPERLVRAIARVLNHACETDIEGAEVLDQRIGQIQVKYGGNS